MRIIGGHWRGRKIAVADKPELRPTPDRVRETLFNWLQPYICDAVCLDMFAGSGALGIEAMSRGSGHLTFLERDRKKVRALRRLLRQLGAEQVAVYEADALHWVKDSEQVFDIVFLDPPFHRDMIERSLSLLLQSGCVNTDSLIYIESEGTHRLGEQLTVIKQARAGRVNYALLKTVAH